MKKFTKFLLAALFMLIPMSIFAQTGDATTPSFDIMSLFTTFAGYAAGVMIITGLITKFILKNLSTTGKSITSWVVAIVVGFVGYFLNLGIFADMEWFGVLVAVVSFAAGSNVLYNVEWIRNLLAALGAVKQKSVK